MRKLRLAGFPSATTAAVYLGWPRCAGAPAICCTSQQTTMRILQPCSPPTFQCSYPSPTCSRGSPPDLHLAAMSTGLLELTLSPAIDHDEGDAFGSPSPHKDSGLRPLPLRRRIGLHLEGCGSRDIFVLSAGAWLDPYGTSRYDALTSGHGNLRGRSIPCRGVISSAAASTIPGQNGGSS